MFVAQVGAAANETHFNNPVTRRHGHACLVSFHTRCHHNKATICAERVLNYFNSSSGGVSFIPKDLNWASQLTMILLFPAERTQL